LKTGFNAEAASAARLRAAAVRAQQEHRPNLARALRELAAEKDSLALKQLEASGQSRPIDDALAAALAEERYENDALYPKMLRDVDGDAAEVIRSVLALQQEHAQRLAEMLDEVTRNRGDLTA
jgi:rubrerythrin